MTVIRDTEVQIIVLPLLRATGIVKSETYGNQTDPDTLETSAEIAQIPVDQAQDLTKQSPGDSDFCELQSDISQMTSRFAEIKTDKGMQFTGTPLDPGHDPTKRAPGRRTD